MTRRRSDQTTFEPFWGILQNHKEQVKTMFSKQESEKKREQDNFLGVHFESYLAPKRSQKHHQICSGIKVLHLFELLFWSRCFCWVKNRPCFFHQFLGPAVVCKRYASNDLTGGDRMPWMLRCSMRAVGLWRLIPGFLPTSGDFWGISSLTLLSLLVFVKLKIGLPEGQIQENPAGC